MVDSRPKKNILQGYLHPITCAPTTTTDTHDFIIVGVDPSNMFTVTDEDIEMSDIEVYSDWEFCRP